MSFIWLLFFFFKQKTAYEMRISDWSSDVCSSDLRRLLLRKQHQQRIANARLMQLENVDGMRVARHQLHLHLQEARVVGFEIDHERRVERHVEIGRASCRERVCQYG